MAPDLYISCLSYSYAVSLCVSERIHRTLVHVKRWYNRISRNTHSNFK